jgi:choline dehydrogenase-like flavoprotein
MARHLRLNSSAETLGSRDNRIDLDDKLVDSAGIPRPRVSFTVDEYTKAGLAYAVDASRKVFEALGVEDIKTDTPYLSSAIICGTTRMGTDPKTSVVDTTLRAHDHKNLFILGTGAHISAPVNAPTLTVAANALRASEKILEDLG